MKKSIFILIAIASAVLSACTFTQHATKVVSWVEKNCPKTEVQNPLTGEINIHFECDSLWQTQRIQNKCEAANLCIDISNGKISGNVRCAGVVPNPFSQIEIREQKTEIRK